jgi:hypothetical protein
VFNDTPYTRRTDFHSRRREFVTGLAVSGASEQQAMRLRYVDSMGKRVRKQYALNTKDPIVARKKLDRLARALTWAGLPPSARGLQRHPVQPPYQLPSRRREFVTGLAVSGANEQTAMRLAHHHDSRVHQRYQLAQFMAVPAEALPKLAPVVPLPSPSSSWVTQATNERAVSGDSVTIPERDTGLEPAVLPSPLRTS